MSFPQGNKNGRARDDGLQSIVPSSLVQNNWSVPFHGRAHSSCSVHSFSCLFKEQCPLIILPIYLSKCLFVYVFIIRGYQYHVIRQRSIGIKCISTLSLHRSILCSYPSMYLSNTLFIHSNRRIYLSVCPFYHFIYSHSYIYPSLGCERKPPASCEIPSPHQPLVSRRDITRRIA